MPPLSPVLQCLLGYYIILNLLSLIMYAWDKSAAIHQAQRIAENRLHLIALIGGCFGAVVGQKLFRHKTRKFTFTVVTWCAILIHIYILITLINSSLI